MYDRVAANQRRTWVLIFGFTVLVVGIGWAFGFLTGYGWVGLPIAVVVAVISSWASYFASDRIALAMSHAQPADPQRDAQLFNIVEGLCLGMGMPQPRLYIVDDAAPNAFATGRNPQHAAVAVTSGLLAKMNRDELEGVLAHELSHVKNRDTLVMTIAVTLVGVTVLLADWMFRAMWWGGGRRDERRGNAGALLAVLAIVLMILAPLVAQTLQFAISRRREYLADADGVLVTRYPAGLISALEKLRDDQTVVHFASRATAHLWIESPIPLEAHEGGTATGGTGAWFNRLFDTHPPLEDRIRVLRESAVGPAA